MNNSTLAERVDPEYLTIPQLAALLQVSEKSVSRWATQDVSMPVLRIGRTVRFPKAELMEWLDRRCQGVARRSRKPSNEHMNHRCNTI